MGWLTELDVTHTHQVRLSKVGYLGHLKRKLMEHMLFVRWLVCAFLDHLET